MLQKKERIDIVIPVFNEEDCLNALLDRLYNLKSNFHEVDLYFIFVNDGSKDKTLKILKKYAAKDPSIKIIDFSRNFGHQIAVTAGIDYARGDYIAIIDADLQDPPELIKDMYYKAKDGFDIVYGRRISRKGETYFKKITAKLFYRFISKMCEIDIPKDTGDFRLINKKVGNALREMREKHRFIRGMVPWVGFKAVSFDYARDERYSGVTKYPLKKMIKFALDAIFSFSNTPLRIAAYSGFTIVLIGLLGAILMLYLKFFTTFTVPGITAVILTIIIMSGIQIIMLGVIGEYVGRIFEESKKRPLYIINEVVNNEDNDEQ